MQAESEYWLLLLCCKPVLQQYVKGVQRNSFSWLCVVMSV